LVRQERYEPTIAVPVFNRDPRPVIRRIVAAALWFPAIIAAYSFIAFVVGVWQWPGPVVAAAVALLVAIDPRGVIWPEGRQASSRSVPEGTPDAPALRHDLAA
jgi:hypothetical protein